MDVALFILMCAGPLGALDVTYFHLWKFRLYQRPESVKEEVTHILRGFLVPAASGILLLGRPEGGWFWAVAGLFAFDSLNTLLDVIFEPGSRAPRIVPPAELAVHFLGTSMMGAAWAVFMWGGWDSRLNPTAIAPRVNSFIPDWSISLGFVALFAAFALVLFETFLFTRAVLRRRTLAAAHA
jgi:hypothetical protein